MVTQVSRRRDKQSDGRYSTELSAEVLEVTVAGKCPRQLNYISWSDPSAGRLESQQFVWLF